MDVHKIGTFKNIFQKIFLRQLKAASVAPAVIYFLAKSVSKDLPWAEPPAREL